MSINRFITQQQYYHYYQPIYHLHSMQLVGYEGLLRSDAYPSPEKTFLDARKNNKLFEIDTLSIEKAISTYKTVCPNETEILFLNIFPSTILHPQFKSFLTRIEDKGNWKRHQLVFEISEAETINNLHHFYTHILELRKEGFLFALDDIGSGFSSIKALIELEPNYIKLDRYFAHNLHTSEKKQAFITAMLNYCKKMGGQLILEGIETEEELEIAHTLQISLVQGNYLGKPTLLTKRGSSCAENCHLET